MISTEGLLVLQLAEEGRLAELQATLSRLCEGAGGLSDWASVRDSDGYTPLHRACYNGHRDVAEYLLSVGASPAARTNDGWTPLHCAAKWGHPGLVQLLLSEGVSPKAVTNGGQTALHLAASGGTECLEVIALLVDHGETDVDAQNAQGDTALAIQKRRLPSQLTRTLERYSQQ